MRILQINTVCGYGSTGRIAVDIALEAENRGHECYIAYGHGTTTYHRAYQIGTYVERKSHNVLSRLTGRPGFVFCKRNEAIYSMDKGFTTRCDTFTQYSWTLFEYGNSF